MRKFPADIPGDPSLPGCVKRSRPADHENLFFFSIQFFFFSRHFSSFHDFFRKNVFALPVNLFFLMKIRPFSRKKSPKFAHLSCFSDSFTQPLTVEWWMPNFLAVSLNVWSTAYLRTSSLNLVGYFAKSSLHLLYA